MQLLGNIVGMYIFSKKESSMLELKSITLKSISQMTKIQVLI